MPLRRTDGQSYGKAFEMPLGVPFTQISRNPLNYSP
jgi:hypothetical protein